MRTNRWSYRQQLSSHKVRESQSLDQKECLALFHPTMSSSGEEEERDGAVAVKAENDGVISGCGGWRWHRAEEGRPRGTWGPRRSGRFARRWSSGYPVQSTAPRCRRYCGHWLGWPCGTWHIPVGSPLEHRAAECMWTLHTGVTTK